MKRKFLNTELTLEEFLGRLFKDTILQGEMDKMKLHEILKLQNDDGSEHILIHNNLYYGTTDFLCISKTKEGKIKFVLFTPVKQEEGE